MEQTTESNITTAANIDLQKETICNANQSIIGYLAERFEKNFSNEFWSELSAKQLIEIARYAKRNRRKSLLEKVKNALLGKSLTANQKDWMIIIFEDKDYCLKLVEETSDLEDLLMHRETMKNRNVGFLFVGPFSKPIKMINKKIESITL